MFYFQVVQWRLATKHGMSCEIVLLAAIDEPKDTTVSVVAVHMWLTKLQLLRHPFWFSHGEARHKNPHKTKL